MHLGKVWSLTFPPSPPHRSRALPSILTAVQTIERALSRLIADVKRSEQVRGGWGGRCMGMHGGAWGCIGVHGRRMGAAHGGPRCTSPLPLRTTGVRVRALLSLLPLVRTPPTLDSPAECGGAVRV